MEYGNQILNADSPDGLELQLHRYLEGRLSERDRIAVEDTLRTDAAARRMLDALREEARLMRGVLEDRVEPSRRLSDKVLMVLHNEERSRLAVLRNRRFRRKMFTVAAMAASLAICVWLIKPLDPAATQVSGTPATLITRNGERKTLTKAGRVYEGDSISSALGQFVRLSFANGTVLDIDEHSRVCIENGGKTPLIRLEAGRIGISTLESTNEVMIALPQRTFEVRANSFVDVWIPDASNAIWPNKIVPLSDLPGVPAPAPQSIVNVLKGAAFIDYAITAGNQAQFTKASPSIFKIDLNSAALTDARKERGWHTAEKCQPDRVAIGIFATPDFEALGKRWNLIDKTLPDVSAALKQLQTAMKTQDAKARAEAMADGQQALRIAFAPLPAEDERRAFERTLEGLAHFERGWALLGSSADRAGAAEAFNAAKVAFQEAMNSFGNAGEIQKAWSQSINSENVVALTDLSPVAQAALIAAFMHPLATYWEGLQTEAQTAAQELSVLRNNVGRSVEQMAARLVEALCLQRAGSKEKAAEMLQEITAISLAGCSKQNRQQADGIKQAAYLALARIYANDLNKTEEVSEEFRLMYPLDAASAAGVELQKFSSKK